MTRRHWRVATTGFAVLVAVLAVVAGIWGPQAWEVVSWVAGAASLAVAVFAVHLSVSPAPAGQPPPPSLTQTATAQGDSRVYQAGRDIGDIQE